MVRLCTLSELSPADIATGYVVVLLGRDALAGTGCSSCDFRDATALFLAPGRGGAVVQAVREPQAPCLCISGEWIEQSMQSPLEGMRHYTFFRYALKEALHLSLRERAVLERSLQDIRDEMAWGMDEYSSTLLAQRVCILLAQCRRFYHRQFIVRSSRCHCQIIRLERVADQYLTSGQYDICRQTAPLAHFASEMDMSQDYLADFLCHETGKTLSQYLNFRHFQLARQLLTSDRTLPLATLAARLGYSSQQCFATAFKRVVGCTPAEYRMQS